MTLSLILGAGGHAKVVADILQLMALPEIACLDDNPDLWGRQVFGLPVLGSISKHVGYSQAGLLVGIGKNQVRYYLVSRIQQHREHTCWLTALHPRSIIAPSVSIGVGTVVAAGVVLNPGVTLGMHVIVNTSASVDHDCVIGDYAHVAPGARLAGSVRVGEGALIGLGALVLPNCTIGEGAVIGAGTVVLHDVPPNTTVVGIPGRILKTHPDPWHSS